MRAVSSFILHLVCVFALVVSCGLPEALHDLGHALSHTENETSFAHQTPGPAASAVETCWIQTLVTSVSQFSAKASGAPAIADTLLREPIVAATPVSVFVSQDWASWHFSRGPPVV